MKRTLIAITAFAALLIIIAAVATLAAPAKRQSGTAGLFGANTVAIIPIKGEISFDKSVSSGLTAEEIVEKLDDAEKDSGIGAILLDIDSGGGSVVASKQIVKKIRKTKKPVVAWISEIGASGAYYAAAASDYVMSDEDSITGSIGAIMFVPNAQRLLGNIGIDVNAIKSGELKDIGSPFKSMTENERQLLEQMVLGSFKRFKSDIIEFRGKNLDVAAFNKIADGRILSGEQAEKIGMVDGFGSKEDAVKKAAALAGIQGEPETKEYAKKDFSLLDLLAESGKSFGEGLKQGLASESTDPKLRA